MRAGSPIVSRIHEGMTQHLLIDVSHHGFGHLAQVVPVLRALRCRVADLRVTVRSKLPDLVLKKRLGEDLRIVPEAKDVGLRMASAVDVLREESAESYREFHRTWKTRVPREARELERLAPDLVLADIPYLTLAAAGLAQIPTVAMCSLNWADIYAHYLADFPGAGAIHEEIVTAYQQAVLFLQPSPHMPMKDLPRKKPVGPVAELGTNRRDEINLRHGLHARERIAVIGLGGVDTHLPIESWPNLPNIRWVVPGNWTVGRSDCISLDELAMPFIDVLCSSDALITKPGYGAFVEAACHGLPVLYIRRQDWPEEPFLRSWLHKHTHAAEVPRGDLEKGLFHDALEELWSEPAHAPIEPYGVEEAAGVLARMLKGKG